MGHRCEIKEWSTCCPIYKLFTLISKKWNIFILKLIGEGHDTFTSLKAALNELNSSILTQRLDELVQEWVVEKKIISEKPRAIRYWLTSSGKEVLKALKPLEKVSNTIFGHQ